jgi:two-component system, sensor histidine kinase RegB
MIADEFPSSLKNTIFVLPQVFQSVPFAAEKRYPFVHRVRLGSSTWLLRLRSFAIVGQLITILGAQRFVDVDLEWIILVLLVGVTALTNFVYAWWLSRSVHAETEDPISDEDHSWAHQSVALGLMQLDLLTLTAMLHITGGADNPFCFFYFVNLAVGGVMILPRAAWSLTLTAIAAYLFLLILSPPFEIFSVEPRIESAWQTFSRLFAFVTCCSVVTYFVTLTAGESQNRHEELLAIQRSQESQRRLQGLTTLAAGAAHELATPLSTIDVVIRELSRHLEHCDKPESVNHDLKLIDDELERCRQILGRMRSAAGDLAGERFRKTTVGDLIDATLEGIRDPHRVDVTDGTERTETTPLWVPSETVAQAIRNLIHNGLDASGSDGRVRLESNVTIDSVVFTISDSGEGMSDGILRRTSEPFFTTKEPGRGIGLGLFLTRNVVSQLGGELRLESRPGVGTRATVEIPLGKPSV